MTRFADSKSVSRPRPVSKKELHAGGGGCGSGDSRRSIAGRSRKRGHRAAGCGEFADSLPAYLLTLEQSPYASFTFFVDRGVSIKRYPLTVIKKLAFAGAVDGKALVAADLLFKTEEPGSAFTPSLGSPKPLMFFQTDFKLDGVSDLNVKSWNLSIDNGSVAHRTLNQSRDTKDIVSPGRFVIDGGFEIYFETDAQRQKFLDASAAALNIILTGDIIEDAFKNQLEFKVPEIRYSAYPMGISKISWEPKSYSKPSTTRPPATACRPC